MRKFFILIPSPHPTGPIKGAVALANSMAKLRSTTLVVLKHGPGIETFLDPQVKYISLATCRNISQKVKTYRRLLLKSGGRDSTASISFCLSADFVNFLCRRKSVTCSSIRGNLLKNYRFDYGLKGLGIATGHLLFLRWFDHIVAMTSSMADQISLFSGRPPQIIGNFVDETMLNHFRIKRKKHKGPLRYIFVGSLTERKQVQLLLHAAYKLKQIGESFHIDIIGDGKLKNRLIKMATDMKVEDVVHFHGHIAQPFPYIAQADCLVLPSLSEGISRAVLESLFLGVPCLLRDADGHNEIIRIGKNGFLFSNNDELPIYMHRSAVWSRKTLNSGESLLPSAYRQKTGAYKYIKMIETNHS